MCSEASVLYYWFNPVYLNLILCYGSKVIFTLMVLFILMVLFTLMVFFCIDGFIYPDGFITARKVMFLHVSVILFTEGSAPLHAGYIPLGSEAGPVQHSACWEIRATSGRYASYWNAILFTLIVLSQEPETILLSSNCTHNTAASWPL